jgi:hypothetical protein
MAVLAPKDPSGLLDPTAAALLQAGFTGLAASGPSRTPVGLGQVFGQAGQAGLNTYQTVATQLIKQQREAAAAEEAKRLHNAQIKDLEAKAGERTAKAEVEKAQAYYLQRPEVQDAIRRGDIGGVLAGMPKLSARDVAILKPDKPQADPQVLRLMQSRDSLPQGHPDRAILDAAIKKATEHAPGVNVYSGSLTAGVDEQGRPVFVQPSGRADVPPRVVPGVRPPPPAADARSGRERAEAEATVSSVRDRIKTMQGKLQSNSYIVGIGGAARRGAEAIGGIVAPDMPTPALDYQNDMRLLLADVRKVIEKDPNLSNQERQNLYETLGGGTFQTPGSAFRTLNNVLGFIENKKMTGPSRDAAAEKRGPTAGQVEDGYRFKGGDPANSATWEKVRE